MAVHPTVRYVEIKVNIASGDADRAMDQLGFAGSDAKRRSIWFYEHANGIDGRGALPLFHHSVIVRVRRKPGGDGDVTVKLRGPDLVVPKAWSEPTEGEGWKFKIEGDWTGQRHSIAASLTVDVDDIDESGGGPDLEALIDDRQVDFLHGSIDLPIDVSVLASLGPIEARTWSPAEVGFFEDVAAEWWRAGSLEFFELSLRVDAAEAIAAQTAFSRFLTDRDVPVSEMEETKTETVLRHFAADG
jgi:hypothetical protein